MLFYQPNNGYCFNSDSIFLYNFASKFKPKGSLLDVGCGVGVIGLLLARDFSLQLTLIEKQENMALYARKNSDIAKIDADIINKDFLDYDTDKKFDFIVSNPPFYHSDVVQSEKEQINKCRYNHHLPIKDFFKKANRIISPRGHFIFCYDASQLSDIFCIMASTNMKIEEIRFVHAKRDRVSKLVLIHARNHSKARLKVQKPFIVFKNDRYTQEAQEIFTKARTHTIKCLI